MKSLVTVLALIASFSAYSQQWGVPANYKDRLDNFTWDRQKIKGSALTSETAAVNAAVDMVGRLRSGNLPSDTVKTVYEAIGKEGHCEGHQWPAKAQFAKGRIIPNGFEVTSKFANTGEEYFQYSLEVLVPCVTKKDSKITRNYEQATWRF